jgi:Arc/MetJ family transcription regulator
MRTNIEIDDELMQKALKATGKSTKREVVEAGLRSLPEIQGQSLIRRSRGTGGFRPEVIADRGKYDIED